MIDSALIEKLWSKATIEPTYIAAMWHVCSGGIQPGTAQPGALASLPILFCEVNGGCREQATPLLTAWTLLRYAGRLLDDVEDGLATEATGKGSATLNLSTGLIFSASLALNELEYYGAESVTAVDIRHAFYAALLQICSGQHLDLTLSTPDLETCWHIAGLKSGLFVGLICWAGARLVSNDPLLLALCRQFGSNLGVMDQIRDDLTDLWDTEHQVSDLEKAHNRGLPVAYALSVLPEVQRKQLQGYLLDASSATGSEECARQLIIESGAAVYLTVQSLLYHQRSVELVQQMSLPDSAKTHLLALLDAARISV
jgi:competence protein ComQ